MKYSNILIEKGYFDERPVLRVRDAEVELVLQTICVEWKEGVRKFRFTGVRSGQGHFVLHNEDGAGDATLHRFQYSTIMEGFWKRNNKSGFWRIHLPDNTLAKVTQLPKPKVAAAAATKRRKPARRVRVAA